MDGLAPAPGNVTYPTRNFATLGPSRRVTHHPRQASRHDGPGHFCPALQVALQLGLYHPGVLTGFGVQSLRIPHLRFEISDFKSQTRPFLLIACTDRIVTANLRFQI